MSTKAKYTEVEWRLLCDSYMAASLCIAAGDDTHFSSLKEAIATERFKTTAKQKYQANALIQAILAEDVSLVDAVVVGTTAADFLEYIEQAVALVNRQASRQEAQEYKQFMYDMATAVANASGEGWFGWGVKISAKEAAVLQRLEALLGLSPQ